MGAARSGRCVNGGHRLALRPRETPAEGIPARARIVIVHRIVLIRPRVCTMERYRTPMGMGHAPPTATALRRYGSQNSSYVQDAP